MSNLYIVRVTEDGELYEYEYGNLPHAREHYSQEESASLFEYKDGNLYMMESK